MIRKAFEDWWWAEYKARKGTVLRRDLLERKESGKYLVGSVEIAWRGWQACAAHYDLPRA